MNERKELAERLLKKNPNRSNRSIIKEVKEKFGSGVGNRMIAKMRKENNLFQETRVESSQQERINYIKTLIISNPKMSSNRIGKKVEKKFGTEEMESILELRSSLKEEKNRPVPVRNKYRSDRARKRFMTWRKNMIAARTRSLTYAGKVNYKESAG